MRARLLLVPLVVCMAACTGDAVPMAPTEVVAPEAVAESPGQVHALAGQSGCHTVKFKVLGWTPTPSVTGDLVGTVVGDAMDFSTVKISGSTVSISGTRDWEITGGTVPGLAAFRTSVDNRNHISDRPGSPALLFENSGKHRALEGVEKANLTYNGTALRDPNTGAFYLDHDFNGVICP